MANFKHSTWIVSSRFVGVRLQAFLRTQLSDSYSGKRIKELIDTHGCRINGKIELFSSYKVKEGDRVQIDPDKLHTTSKQEPIRVLYEDENLWIIDKPSGLCSDAKEIEKAFNQGKVYLVHRLDKETSGVLLLAKNPSMQKLLEELFKKREIHKVYHAITQGKPAHPIFKVENALGKISSYEGQSIWGSVDPSKGSYALTYFEVLKKSKEHSLIKCMPVTGRTHQIRTHLQSKSLPIVGDYHYFKDRPFLYKAPRTFLHAYSVTFNHPKLQQSLTIEAPYPQDFNKAFLEIFS